MNLFSLNRHPIKRREISQNTVLKRSLFLGIAGLLGACQSGLNESFLADEQPSDWIGETPIALINAWGNPTQVINNDGTQYLIYISAENMAFGDDFGETATGPLTMINGYPQALPTGKLFCQTTFVVRHGEIVDAMHNGDGC